LHLRKMVESLAKEPIIIKLENKDLVLNYWKATIIKYEYQEGSLFPLL
jgi:hypothetical protein